MPGLTAAPIRFHRAGAVLLSLLLSSVLALCAGAPAWGQAAGPAPIYTCTDASGKKLTSDRPIAECNAREQRVLNADGSVKRVVPPAMTSEERSDAEARDREAETRRIEQRDAIKRDRNLLARFPNEAAHRKSRELALDDVRTSLRQSEARLIALASERRPLTNEAEFYVGKQLPLKLKLGLDANDASVEAQKSLVQNQQIEILRIDKLYDTELERLRKLWSGAQPGSLGVAAVVPAPVASAPRKR